jgi:uncharacterized protein YqgV (UPF0045/DUF77 family)
MNTNQAKKRTLPQNRALHKYCTEVANELNAHGISLKAIVTRVNVDWTMEAVKSVLQAIAKAKFEKAHTSELTTTEIQDVYLEFNKIISELGISMGWPSIDNTDEALESYTQLKKY